MKPGGPGFDSPQPLPCSSEVEHHPRKVTVSGSIPDIPLQKPGGGKRRPQREPERRLATPAGSRRTSAPAVLEPTCPAPAARPCSRSPRSAAARSRPHRFLGNDDGGPLREARRAPGSAVRRGIADSIRRTGSHSSSESRRRLGLLRPWTKTPAARFGFPRLPKGGTNHVQEHLHQAARAWSALPPR